MFKTQIIGVFIYSWRVVWLTRFCCRTWPATASQRSWLAPPCAWCPASPPHYCPACRPSCAPSSPATYDTAQLNSPWAAQFDGLVCERRILALPRSVRSKFIFYLWCMGGLWILNNCLWKFYKKSSITLSVLEPQQECGRPCPNYERYHKSVMKSHTLRYWPSFWVFERK